MSDPLHVVLLIDCSGSVKGRLSAVKQAAFSLADHLREKGKVGVVSYSGEGVQIRCKLTDNWRTLKKAFSRLRAGGTSPMATAIFLADEEILREEDALKAIVLFSDGKPSNPQSVINCVNKAQERGIRFITVEVGPESNLEFLKGISSDPKDCHLLADRGDFGEKAQEIIAGLSEKAYLPLAAPSPLSPGPGGFQLSSHDQEEGAFILLPDGQRLREEDRQGGEEPRNVIEQRRSLRMSVSLKVDYKYGDTWATGEIGNISVSGVFLLTDSLIRPGEELLLQFLPSDLPASRPIRVMGEVSRVVKLEPQEEGGGTYPTGLGIKFKNIHSQSKSDFDQYIKKLTEALKTGKTKRGGRFPGDKTKNG